MIGAIIGDMVGSVYEWRSIKSTQFDLFCYKSRFIDDSVMTIATADVLLNGLDYAESYNKWGRLYFNAGYGRSFLKWIRASVKQPYNSFGNGSAMRVSPVGWMFDTLEDTLAEAERSAECTHNHPDGIAGAKAVAGAIFLARSGKSKDDIRMFIEQEFQYDLSRSIESIRPDYSFDVTCPGSVPEAIIAFLESANFESAIRLAVSLGGDSDTQACIAGSIAEAFYKDIPDCAIESNVICQARELLDEPMLEIVDQFYHTLR
ncbi:MAG: ADP-ribosylglycohydrolase family protein [Planctomycetia bacterium]|nr:ADP-ribosylglycohydrolase family protein [Planctomycetia bacterium]